MTYDEERVVTRSEHVEATQAPPPGPGTAVPGSATSYDTAVVQERTSRSGDTAALAKRVIVFVFGLIQLLLALRVVLLLLNAREGNDLVSFVYDISDPFVAPFRGILGRDAVARGGTFLDTAALLAMVGWTVLEVVLVSLLRVFRRNA